MAEKNDIIPYNGGDGQPNSLTPFIEGYKFEPVDDCKLCKSKYRLEAEELYDRTQNIKRVHKLLTEDRCEEISYGACRNHLKYHYEAYSSNQLVQALSTEVEKWLFMQNDQMQGLHRTAALLEREINIISAHSEGLPLPERRKNDDTVAKLGALLLSYRAKIAEMQEAKEPVTLVLNQMQIIFQDELKGVHSDEARRVVKNILAKMKDAVGHLPAGGD